MIHDLLIYSYLSRLGEPQTPHPDTYQVILSVVGPQDSDDDHDNREEESVSSASQGRLNASGPPVERTDCVICMDQSACSSPRLTSGYVLGSNQ